MTSLRPDFDVRELEANLYSVFDREQSGAPYDSKAAAYDRMVSSDGYLRLAWGGRRSTIYDFLDAAFASDVGIILDLAAGTSVDAYRAYATTTRPTFVVDLSLEMLRMGKDRVIAELGRVPDNTIFLQADALDLPFKDRTLSTILCHGSFHLFPDLDTVLSEWKRTLREDGCLFVSSLVRERLVGNLCLVGLARLGEVSKPMSAEVVSGLVASGLGRQARLDVEGNFAYVRTERA